MAGLWKPDAIARSALSSGNRKERLGWLKLGKEIEQGICPYCGNPCYLPTERDKFLTLGGSVHKCVGMKSLLEDG